jgi:hypothetical protein
VKPVRYLFDANLKKDSVLVSIPDIENKEIELERYDKVLKTEGYLLLVNSSSSLNEKIDSSDRDPDPCKAKESDSLIITNDKGFIFSNEPPAPKHMQKFIFSAEVYCEICGKV